MNKSELITNMAKQSGLTKTDTEKLLNAYVNCVQNALKKGDKISLIGFGTFDITSRKATEGRNPRTGEPIKIPASKLPKFKPGKAFKNFVNGKSK